jgi:hypothetical protein
MDSTTLVALLGIAGTLGGAALGQFIALRSKRMELKEQRLREDRNALLAGIRELHFSILEYNGRLVSFTSKVLRSKSDLLSRLASDRLDAADNLFFPLNEPWAKMGSLQLLYASELGIEWLKLGTAQDNLIPAVNDFLGGNIDVDEFQDAVHTLSNQAMSFVGDLTDKYLIISGDPFIQLRLQAKKENIEKFG